MYILYTIFPSKILQHYVNEKIDSGYYHVNVISTVEIKITIYSVTLQRTTTFKRLRDLHKPELDKFAQWGPLIKNLE